MQYRPNQDKAVSSREGCFGAQPAQTPPGESLGVWANVGLWDCGSEASKFQALPVLNDPCRVLD